MAEGLLRQRGGDRYVALSAGADPSGYVHPLAIRVMDEIDIDISAHSSKSIREFLPPEGTPPDLIVSICDSAAENCPVFPGDVERLHLPFDDPAHATGSDEEKLVVFRRVRDEIREAIEERFIDSE